MLSVLQIGKYYHQFEMGIAGCHDYINQLNAEIILSNNSSQ